MIFVIVLLVLTVGLSRGNASYSADNDTRHNESYIQSGGKGLKFSDSGCFQVITNNGFTITVKRSNSKLTNTSQKKIQPQFYTSLPLIRLGSAENYYYFEVSLKMNYFQAFQFCRKNHMDLLSIESKEEDDLIEHCLLNKFPKVGTIWTSGTDLGDEGKYTWLSTGEPFNFTNWYSLNVVQPDNFKNSEHCIHIYQSLNPPNSFFWNDISCKNIHNFVCETKPIVLTT